MANLRAGDRVRDTLTGSEWTIESIRHPEPEHGMVWHRLVSDHGATRRVSTADLIERYRKVLR